ncbi:MAG TPA: PEPxxWA-CTERM sorting domain-containing protein, partial [Polymorphobacter sp.]|nr:PEPxxWA-CTERM sorting domain-containing protein [Polymorphobacter sp.]
QTHYLTLVNSGNIEGGGDIYGFMDGDFTWSIAAAGIPEPASWAMLIAGFGMVGGALRSQRRVVA